LLIRTVALLQNRAYLLLLCDPLNLSQLSLAILLLLSQIRVLLNLGLVQTVDNRILARTHVDPLHLLVVLEAHLASSHRAILLQVRPRRVDDSDVVLLVALDRVGFGQLRAIREQLLGNCVPGLVVAHAQVDVGGTEVVDVEPDIFGPAVGDQILISLKQLAGCMCGCVGRGGSRTLYFVLADVDVRRGLDDVAREVEDHVAGILQSCLFVEGVVSNRGNKSGM
jgi:hypothetical protein